MGNDARKKFIETATPLFAAKGYHGVSIRELAQAAGANSALISYYFGGKEGLYAAVLENLFMPVQELLQSAQSRDSADSLQTLHMYTQAVATIHTKFPYLSKFIHRELVDPTQFLETVVKKYIKQIQNILHNTIGHSLAAGCFRREIEPSYAVVALAGMMNFYFLVKPLIEDFVPDTQAKNNDYVNQAIDIYLNGIIQRDNEDKEDKNE